MIHLTSETQVMIAAKPVDFRKGIDGLAGLCEHILRQNPRSGTLFVFVSRDATKIRILAYEGNGFWLMTKRLSSGRFTWPKAGEEIENNLSLSIKDMKLLLEILQSYAHLSEQLSDNDITLHKLRKLAGLVKSSEKLSNITDKAKADKPDKQKSTKEKKEKPEIEHKVCHHKLEGLAKGDECPKCGKGKLYKYEPAITVRISGDSPLVSTKHIRERLRCNACGEYFTAELPKEVKDDGGEENMYTYSARAIMAILRLSLSNHLPVLRRLTPAPSGKCR